MGRTVLSTARPDAPVSHVDEGEGGVEGGHQEVRQGQVQQEVVRRAPHPPEVGVIGCNWCNLMEIRYLIGVILYIRVYFLLMIVYLLKVRVSSCEI